MAITTVYQLRKSQGKCVTCCHKLDAALLAAKRARCPRCAAMYVEYDKRAKQKKRDAKVRR